LQVQSSLGAPPGAGTAAWHAWQQSGNLPPTPHTPVTPSRFSSKPGKLTVQDKDVLLVLTAFCKLASREAPGSSSSDSVLAQGKLLALEMLAKVRAPPGAFEVVWICVMDDMWLPWLRWHVCVFPAI
jgi:hypothetical protein